MTDESTSSAVVQLSEKKALQHATSVAVQIGSGSDSGRLALKGTADQLVSALTAIGGKANLVSAVITLQGRSPAGKP